MRVAPGKMRVIAVEPGVFGYGAGVFVKLAPRSAERLSGFSNRSRP
jgi:3D (Asp-Asp-Asp) domain-containing protein